MPPRVIDAHQHFWEAAAMPWMSGPYAMLAAEHGPGSLRPLLRDAGVDATVLVQARSSLEETRWLLGVAEATDFVAGVVGWLPLEAPDAADILAALRAGPHGRWLVGVRHQVHDEPDPAWLGRAAVRRGLAVVAEASLVFDLLVRPRELPACVALAREMPQLRLVLDHAAKPPIAAGNWQPWAADVARLAAYGQVGCKLSGLVTEADHSAWGPADLRPYVAHALDVFGPERCMFGSDWPVCRVAGGYKPVMESLWTVLDDIGVTPDQRQAIMGGVATRTYGLA